MNAKRESQLGVVKDPKVIENEAEDASLHPIFTRDPSDWMQYLHKEVCVSTVDGNSHTGRVYTIDPVSETIVLVKLQEDEMKLEMLIGHAVDSVVVLDENTGEYPEKFDRIFKPEEVIQFSQKDLEKRKSQVKTWLLKNRIPVEMTGANMDTLSISDALFIEPPYTVDSCRCTNEIMLGKIQGLIRNMPSDVEEWQ